MNPNGKFEIKLTPDQLAVLNSHLTTIPDVKKELEKAKAAGFSVQHLVDQVTAQEQQLKAILAQYGQKK